MLCLFVTDGYMNIIHYYIVSLFIISMTKLLDADWSRGVQLFH